MLDQPRRGFLDRFVCAQRELGAREQLNTGHRAAQRAREESVDLDHDRDGTGDATAAALAAWRQTAMLTSFQAPYQKFPGSWSSVLSSIRFEP